MELDQGGNSRTLAWTSLPLWCKADCQTQSLEVVHFLVTADWRNIAKYLGLETALQCTAAALERCS